MSNEKLIIGIDAGGTNIRLAVAEVGGDLQNAAPTIVNASEDGGPEPLQSLLSSLDLNKAQVVSIAAGITKVSRTGIVDRWESLLQGFFPTAALQVVPDFQIAFHGAVPSGVGVGALAGTGAVIYGENASGNAVRVGGRGWEYGDEGSGAWLTTEAIRRTLRGLDGMEEMTPLCHKIGEHLGESIDAGKLGEAARRITQEQGRGFLVPLLVEQAGQGDAEAANLFVGASGWLGAQVRTALRRLDFEPSSPVTIARMGGLWDVGSLLTDPFSLVMARWYPEANIIPADATPIIGALRLAEQGLKPH